MADEIERAVRGNAGVIEEKLLVAPEEGDE